MWRHILKVGFCHLQEVADHLVVPQLKVRDVAGTLLLLHVFIQNTLAVIPQ